MALGSSRASMRAVVYLVACLALTATSCAFVPQASIGSGNSRKTVLKSATQQLTLADRVKSIWQLNFGDVITQSKNLNPERKYLNLLLKPFFQRATVRTQVSEDIFLFEQTQGFVNVSTNIRMTVIRLSDGGLWVHAPVGPTKECVKLLNELGEVKYIVHPTTALDHKVYVGPMSRAFPKAQVWVCPGQWSWPINIPSLHRVDGTLEDGSTNTPWAEEIDQRLFQPPTLGVGPANEVCFFHKPSKSLIVTDLVVYVDSTTVPSVMDKSELIESAYYDEGGPPLGVTEATVKQEVLRRGWQRMALQILFLGPPKLATFATVSDRLIVSPVIQTFVFNRVKAEVEQFVIGLCEWDFKQIIGAHFTAPVPATPSTLRQAFSLPPPEPRTRATPWESLVNAFSTLTASPPKKIPAADMETLSNIDAFLTKAGIASK